MEEYFSQMEKIKAGVAILLSEKMNFKTKAIKRNKEGNFIIIKGSIQQEDIILVSIYVSNV